MENKFEEKTPKEINEIFAELLISLKKLIEETELEIRQRIFYEGYSELSDDEYNRKKDMEEENYNEKKEKAHAQGWDK